MMSRFKTLDFLLKSNRSFTFIRTPQRCVSNAKPYNTISEQEKRRDFVRKKLQYRFKRNEIKPETASLPITLRYINNSEVETPKTSTETCVETNKPVQFPYSYEAEVKDVKPSYDKPVDTYETIDLKNKLIKEKKNWMLNYDNFDDTSHDEEVEDGDINYGTPDPNSRISDVPCGGCGAHLHCKDPSLPGYLPSEIYKNSWKKGGAHLTALICQRCYFLKHLNIALEVQVSTDDYPKVLQTISSKTNAVVVLMVDLTDFPCSIWPGIADIFYGKPIIVVGNKVDLLPKDGSNYLKHIRKKLTETIKSHGFVSTKLIDVVLTSATTGYGVEHLITVLHNSWKYKGNVYLVGCTNVGKSSLFNALIKSDYCKSQAEDLIQRATTSFWPGTTLNLLKFPIAKPSGYKLELRKRRLLELEKLERHETQLKKEFLKKSNDTNYAILMGRIDRTIKRFDENEGSADTFSMNPSNNATGQVKLGVNEKDRLYAFSRWCYDTPGVVQKDHILHLLTTEELFSTIPKRIIAPRIFNIKSGETLFIAGLARLDFISGEQFARFTVFSSDELPISVCKTEEAEEFYSKNVGTNYFKVPSGGEERLKKWPGLKEGKLYKIKGIDLEYSSNDIVLSNVGWISISGQRNLVYEFKAWTPEGRGIHLRDCLLPQAVNLRGPRIKFSPAFKIHKYYENKSG